MNEWASLSLSTVIRCFRFFSYVSFGSRVLIMMLVKYELTRYFWMRMSELILVSPHAIVIVIVVVFVIVIVIVMVVIAESVVVVIVIVVAEMAVIVIVILVVAVIALTVAVVVYQIRQSCFVFRKKR